MNKVYLLLGSNMGNSRQQLEKAIRHLEKKTGRLVRCSGLYATAAWGNMDQHDFLNQVVVIETALNAVDMLHRILTIEKLMGRVRTFKNAPRIIDIDILFFNKEIIRQPHLVVPHPEIQNRRFALTPLNEIAPQLKHPVFNKTMHQLLLHCEDRLNVKKF